MNINQIHPSLPPTSLLKQIDTSLLTIQHIKHQVNLLLIEVGKNTSLKREFSENSNYFENFQGIKLELDRLFDSLFSLIRKIETHDKTTIKQANPEKIKEYEDLVTESNQLDIRIRKLIDHSNQLSIFINQVISTQSLADVRKIMHAVNDPNNANMKQKK